MEKSPVPLARGNSTRPTIHSLPTLWVRHAYCSFKGREPIFLLKMDTLGQQVILRCPEENRLQLEISSAHQRAWFWAWPCRHRRIIPASSGEERISSRSSSSWQQETLPQKPKIKPKPNETQVESGLEPQAGGRPLGRCETLGGSLFLSPRSLILVIKMGTTGTFHSREFSLFCDKSMLTLLRKVWGQLGLVAQLEGRGKEISGLSRPAWSI